MPELPEVETTCRGLKQIVDPFSEIVEIQIQCRGLREKIHKNTKLLLCGQRIEKISRRAKYILLETGQYTILSHLGMSGTWRELTGKPQKHDHLHIHLSNGRTLTYNDPRRFGLFLFYNKGQENQCKWLKNLGVEPLQQDFTAEYLQKKSYGRKINIKNFIMDQKVVVGIGNIYASEILFQAGVKPERAVGRVKLEDWQRVITATKQILNQAILNSGTTLRDFHQTNGQSGKFQNNLFVYARAKQLCYKCRSPIRTQTIGGRSTFWCSVCQI